MVRKVKSENVSLVENRHLVSLTPENKIQKIEVGEVKLAVGFEKGGMELKFDDYSLCFNSDKSEQDRVENALD